MQLRDHPLMSYRGVPNWPPVWTLRNVGTVNTLKGEVGVLKYVDYDHDRNSNKCFLVIDHQSSLYTGCLIYQDRSFCNQIAHVMRTRIGRSIKEIGNIDLSYTL
jgi:hypothetical protein